MTTYLPYSVNPDALAGALSHLRNNWGEEIGHRIVAVEPLGLFGCRITVRASDGSEWSVASNNYSVPLDPATGTEWTFLPAAYLGTRCGRYVAPDSTEAQRYLARLARTFATDQEA